MRKSWLTKFRRGLAALLVVALVLLAVSMSLLRLAVAYAPQLREQVEQVLAQALERPLTLGGMRATWAGRHPRLILEDVRLTGGSLAGLEVPELEADIDLWRSLQTMQLQLAQVQVSALTVRAIYAADGSLRVTQIGNAKVTVDDLDEGQGPRSLPARIQLRDAVVQLTDIAADTTYRLNDVDLDLTGLGRGYALGGYIPLPTALGQSIRFRAEWQGGPGSPDPVTGRLYVDARRLRLHTLSGLLARLAPVPALQGNAHVEFWAELGAHGMTQASGRVALLDLALQDQVQQWQTVAGQVKGEFQWRQQAQGWDLAVADLLVASPYRVWPATELSLRFRQQPQAQALALRGDYLHLGDLGAAAGVLPLIPEELRQWLRAAKPTAELLQPQVALRWGEGSLQDFTVSTYFRSAGLQPVGHVPGAAGLAGSLRADMHGGYLNLNTQQGELRFASLFREPLPFQRLQGETYWRLADGGWTVEAPQLRISSEDGQAQARLRLVSTDQGLPFIDLRAQVTEGNAAQVSRYLPVPVLSESVLDWLDGAGIHGRVPKADVVLFGRLDEFPYRRNDGLFLVQAELADAGLDYHSGWPPVQAAAGQLRFLGDSMTIHIDSGLVHEAAIQQAEARIEHLGVDPLLIEGQVLGSGQQLLGFLQESPLGKDLRQQLADMRLSGTHRVDLSLRIPFEPEPQVQAQGSIALNNASYQVPKWDLRLDNLQGLVRFTERGVTAQQVTGRYRGLPATLRADTIRRGNRELIQVSGRLRASPERLLGEKPLPGVQGEADWEVRLLLPGFQSPPPARAPLLELLVDSDLRGVAVDLPAPLGKGPAAAKPLQLAIPIRETGTGPAALRYGEQLRALLAFAPDSLDIARAAVQLGEGALELPPRGLVIRGSLEALDLSGWDWPGEAGAAAPGLQLQLVDVHFGRLRVMGQEFRDTALQARTQGGGWSIELQGPDVAGDVELPADPARPIQVQLQRLSLQPPEQQTGAARKVEATAELPALDATVSELALRGQVLGQLELYTRKVADGTVIKQARINGPLLDLQAAGGWSRSTAHSQLQAELKSGNVGQLLDALGYGRAMRSGSLQGSMDVAWSGKLLDFSLPALTGALDLSLRNGQILAVEPGAGRLFGLLSIGELPRRLSLDFSDLFGRGFAYDRIEAHFQLADGDAHTRQFYMQGPAARVDLSGRIGLAARDYDQRVTVTPNVSTALPAIGAVAGGPIGAVAGYVTQKLLQDELNKLSRYRYRVAGSWDSPQIEPLATSAGEASEQAQTRLQEAVTP